MTTKNLFVKRLSRFPVFDESDDISFTLGVNVLIGPPNTGKSKWLSMLDYLMGEPGSPEDAFGEDLAAKYERVRAVIEINGEEIAIERRWKERGSRTKVFVNETPINAGDFSVFILERLGIPVLHIPKGNPYSDNTWPELSWRMLLRHIYRQQRFWADFADKQPEREQLACLLHFLGVAEHLYSEQYNDLVAKSKQIIEFQGAKKQFANILSEVSKEIIDEQEIQVSPTVASLDQVIERITVSMQELQEKRESIIYSLTENVESQNAQRDGDAFHQLREEWSRYQDLRERILLQLNQTTQRLEELQNYRTSITNELGRLSRVKSAGRIFGALKVTHCPACDQPIQASQNGKEQCYLCKQPLLGEVYDSVSAEDRINLEVDQLRSELQEANELIDKLSTEREQAQTEAIRIDEALSRIDAHLRPVRRATAAILPPEIGILDMEVGRLQERIRQLDRIKGALRLRDDLSKQIDTIQAEISRLEAAVNQQEALINFSQSADVMTEGMNTYLNTLVNNGRPLWTQSPIYTALNDRAFTATVGKSKWSTILGGTLMLYFLMSYHYALLNLSNKEPYHYPGFAILDFPATLEDGATVEDKENYILEPFIKLLDHPSMRGTQLIVTGASFEGLAAANRIEFTRIWRA